MLRKRSRRASGAIVAFALTASALGCGSVSGVEAPGGGVSRLTARPHPPTVVSAPGTTNITPANVNDGFLMLPASYTPGKPIPLVVALHGAGMGAQSMVNLLGPYVDPRGFALLAVGARGLTWDVMTYKYSYDVAFIDGALAWTFDRVNVDPSRIIILGFSDGASYALGLALTNGDLFTRAVAFSPGFIPRTDSPASGKPEFFDSHGRQDPVLDIDGASRAIVATLKSRGYVVNYVEFDGGHTVPSDILSAAADWWMR